MSQPYCAQADAMNEVLTNLLTQAGWNVVSNLPSSPSDVDLRIQEGDSEIDSRLAAMGYALPFSTNPTWVKQTSVIYARYACFRDLYAGGSPSAGTKAVDEFLTRFNDRFQKLEDGWSSLVDSTGAVIAPTKSKFGVGVAQNTAPVDVAPGGIISSYVSEVDENDGLTPSDGSDDDDGI